MSLFRVTSFPVRASTISTQRELSAVSGLPGTKSGIRKQSFAFLDSA